MQASVGTVTEYAAGASVIGTPLHRSSHVIKLEFPLSLPQKYFFLKITPNQLTVIINKVSMFGAVLLQLH